jgi:hypothetical protein
MNITLLGPQSYCQPNNIQQKQVFHTILLGEKMKRREITKTNKYNFHSHTVHLDIIKVFYLPTDAQENCFKKNIKIYIKQLLHVSVQSPSSGSALFDFAKVMVVKIIN